MLVVECGNIPSQFLVDLIVQLDRLNTMVVATT
jgi:hypothetical protein